MYLQRAYPIGNLFACCATCGNAGGIEGMDVLDDGMTTKHTGCEVPKRRFKAHVSSSPPHYAPGAPCTVEFNGGFYAAVISSKKPNGDIVVKYTKEQNSFEDICPRSALKRIKLAKPAVPLPALP